MLRGFETDSGYYAGTFRCGDVGRSEEEECDIHSRRGRKHIWLIRKGERVMYSILNRKRGRPMFNGRVFETYAEAYDWMMDYAIATETDEELYIIYPVALSGMEHETTYEIEGALY